jgi:hypothetical protein
MSEQYEAPLGGMTVSEAVAAEKAKQKRNHMDFNDQRTVDSFLKANLISRGDGLWEYAPGWSDAKIAEAAGQERRKTITVGNVAGFRTAYYGQLVKVVKREDNSDLLERLYEQHARIQKIELWMQQYDQLCKVMQHEINTLRLKLESKSMR